MREEEKKSNMTNTCFYAKGSEVTDVWTNHTISLCDEPFSLLHIISSTTAMGNYLLLALIVEIYNLIM